LRHEGSLLDLGPASGPVAGSRYAPARGWFPASSSWWRVTTP